MSVHRNAVAYKDGEAWVEMPGAIGAKKGIALEVRFE